MDNQVINVIINLLPDGECCVFTEIFIPDNCPAKG